MTRRDFFTITGAAGGALFAGPDGLDVFRRFIPELDVPWAALEVGAGQADTVSSMFEGRQTKTIKDLAGIERVVVAWA